MADMENFYDNLMIINLYWKVFLKKNYLYGIWKHKGCFFFCQCFDIFPLYGQISFLSENIGIKAQIVLSSI